MEVPGRKGAPLTAPTLARLCGAVPQSEEAANQSQNTDLILGSLTFSCFCILEPESYHDGCLWKPENELETVPACCGVYKRHGLRAFFYCHMSWLCHHYIRRNPAS